MNRPPTRMPPPNPISQGAHHRQMFWQVYFPLLISVVLLLAGGTLAATSGTAQAGNWAGISVIFLILPVIASGVVGLILLALLIYGLARLLGILPSFSSMIQGFFRVLSFRATGLTDKLVNPIFRLNSFGASFQKFFKIFLNHQK